VTDRRREDLDRNLGEWFPLTIRETAALFVGAPFRWWISGGQALELFTGRSWRRHDDTDVGICRQDAPALPDILGGWDLHLASSGRLTPWSGEPLWAELNQNNVWCRPSPSSPWRIDVTIGEGNEHEWIYRRDPSLRLPWREAVLQSEEGIPYLAPELQLLFKSKKVRPKDEEDAREVIGSLTASRRSRLTHWLPEGHPWMKNLARD
jgi:hypothetical protein